MSLWDSFKMAVLEPQTMGYGAASGFMFGCLLAYVASAQQIFVEVFGLGSSFPRMFGAVASVMAVASFLNSRLVGGLGMRRVSHTALAGFLTVSLMMAAVAESGHASLPVFAVLMASAFFLFGLIAPNFNALAMEKQGDRRHRGRRYRQIVRRYGSAAGPRLCGLQSDHLRHRVRGGRISWVFWPKPAGLVIAQLLPIDEFLFQTRETIPFLRLAPGSPQRGAVCDTILFHYNPLICSTGGQCQLFGRVRRPPVLTVHSPRPGPIGRP